MRTSLAGSHWRAPTVFGASCPHSFSLAGFIHALEVSEGSAVSGPLTWQASFLTRSHCLFLCSCSWSLAARSLWNTALPSGLAMTKTGRSLYTALPLCASTPHAQLGQNLHRRRHCLHHRNVINREPSTEYTGACIVL